jgi:hypothetical protein
VSESASVDLRVTRSRLTFPVDAVYLGTDLARAMNSTTTGEGVALRYAVTPLTTLSFNVDRERNRFHFTPERDANSVRVAPSVEFKPFALVSGRALIGFKRTTFSDPGIPEFRGIVALVDLAYSLLERTRFGVSVQRDLGYSYRGDQQSYLLSGVTGSVTQQLADAWDVRATIGRSRLTYRGDAPGNSAPAGASSQSETVLTYGGQIGYTVGRATRLAFHADYRERASGLPRRGYERFGIGSSVTYGF